MPENVTESVSAGDVPVAVAVTSNEYEPDSDGVPVMAPVAGSSERPAGKAPAVIE